LVGLSFVGFGLFVGVGFSFVGFGPHVVARSPMVKDPAAVAAQGLNVLCPLALLPSPPYLRPCNPMTKDQLFQSLMLSILRYVEECDKIDPCLVLETLDQVKIRFAMMTEEAAKFALSATKDS
jgi:hypothetical protein